MCVFQGDVPSGEEATREEEKEADNQVTKDEVLRFPTNCPECNAPAETNMKVTGESFLLQSLLRKLDAKNTLLYRTRSDRK